MLRHKDPAIWVEALGSRVQDLGFRFLAFRVLGFRALVWGWSQVLDYFDLGQAFPSGRFFSGHRRD